MKKILPIFLILVATISLFAPVKVVALSVNHRMVDEKKETKNGVTDDYTSGYNQEQNCDTLLGNPENEDSVAWLVQKILNYIQILGPILVVILSSIDFAKVIITSDDDSMAKATKRLTTRLILAASLFFLPVLVSVLLNTFGLTSDPTCGLK